MCSILRLGKFGRKNRGILLKSLDIGKLLGGLLPKSKDLRNTASIFFFELCDCLKPVLDLIELPGIEIQLFKLLAQALRKVVQLILVVSHCFSRLGKSLDVPFHRFQIRGSFAELRNNAGVFLIAGQNLMAMRKKLGELFCVPNNPAACGKFLLSPSVSLADSISLT